MGNQRDAGRWRAAFTAFMVLGFSLITWQSVSISRTMGLSCEAEAGGKKCACPVMPGETVVLPCSSQLDPQSCGVCSVMTAEKKRDGRSCIAVQ